MKQGIIRPGIAGVIGTAAAAALVLAGCAGGAAPTPTATTEVPTSPEAVTIATVTPGTGSPPIVLGIAAGIYEDHMIDLTEISAPSAVANLVIGGEADLAASAWVPVIIAASQGIPLTAVVPAGSMVAEGGHGFFVRSDSGITDGMGLEGKTVAVNALGSLGEMALRELIEQDGGDPKAVNVTELSFPDMIAALEQGNVDAAWLPGPFYMAGNANANLELLSDFADIKSIAGVPNIGYFGMQDWAAQNGPLIERFNLAITESIDLINSDQSLIRKAYVELGGMPEALAESIAIEPQVAVVPKENVQRLIDLMVKWGLIDQAPEIDALYPSGS